MASSTAALFAEGRAPFGSRRGGEPAEGAERGFETCRSGWASHYDVFLFFNSAMRERMTEHRGGDEAHDALCSPFSPSARRRAAAIKQIGRHARRKESIRQRPPRPPRPPRAAAAAAACGKPCTLLTTIKNSGRYSGSGGKQEKGTRLLMNLSNALSL